MNNRAQNFNGPKKNFTRPLINFSHYFMACFLIPVMREVNHLESSEVVVHELELRNNFSLPVNYR